VNDRPSSRSAYAAAGVDVEAGELAVSLLRERIGAAGVGGRDLLGELGGFGAAVELPAGMARPVLVAATDGVGTKTEIARRMGVRTTIGRDLVAMCADDVVCHGARPFLFLDYLAVGRLDPAVVAELVSGVADGCRDAGCALVGGETAEHPGLMEADAFDLAGFCLGLVDRDRIVDGSGARSGDVLIGLASSGLHANGYALVRAVLAREGLDLGTPMASLDGDAGADSRTLGEALLEPTRIHAADVLAVIDGLGHGGGAVRGIAHVTGGGLPGNLPRAVGRGLGVEVDPRSWPVPPIVAVMGRLAGLGGAELRATFNGGIGMALVVPPASVDRALAILAERGAEAWRIGRVVEAAMAGPSRYREVG
jgi:phosphoribosylformylglycinamidine cyclo-ligase